MLQLKDITKNYSVASSYILALKGINIEFRKSEFVSILGPSGCGKTTMLNIIGGLDRYTEGDLIINNRSTKEYKDKDWDSYRNHRIGFVFQNYNLIPHQSVLANVELALTLSGVSKAERRKRAKEALELVGLGSQINKKPNQMSGGQMQRVAIARAIVNNPDIILADEPTGALDSETSVQVMNILKDIAKNKLVIMVTHNGDLATEYSTRIVRLLDGKIIDDSNPYSSSEENIQTADSDASVSKKKKKEKVSMSYTTALSLSLKNLLTKKGRTFLTAFAGSIGIIGIALILSMSNGFQKYIDKVQQDTISTYPISITEEVMDYTSMMQSMLGTDDKDNFENADSDKIYTKPVLNETLKTLMKEIKVNDLAKFKKYIEDNRSNLEPYINDIQYTYGIDLNIYAADTSKEINKVNPSTMMMDMYGYSSGDNPQSSLMTQFTTVNLWTQMMDNRKLLDSQYDVIAGKWPEKYNEVVIVVNKDNSITDFTEYALGIRNAKELKNIINLLGSGKEINSESKEYNYDDLMNLKFKLVLSPSYFRYNEKNKRWEDKSKDENYVKDLINNGIDINVVGIIRPSEDAVATSIQGSIAYTKELVEEVLDRCKQTDIVKEQLNNKDVDVFTSLPFIKDNEELENITVDDVKKYIATLPAEQQQMINAYIGMMNDEQLIDVFKSQIQTVSAANYDDNMKKLGFADISKPATINIYAKDFESKDEITDFIDKYNDMVTAAGNEKDTIEFTDYVGLMMSSVSSIINAISYVLIAFVSIALVVSSIMIGIITYISVLERTKEIGILRSIGASKRDVSRVFNAETLIVGLVSGSLGIGITILLDIPINFIIKKISGISNVARLPWQGALILIGISMFLTLVAGLIPSKIASKKDPVIALRSE